MATKIFITGATGYIGGDILFALEKAHYEYEYTALVRNLDKGALLLEEESARADIVIHTADASDNANAAKAIAKRLAEGHTNEHPGLWLHTSGTGILTWYDSEIETYGEPPSQAPYGDLENVRDLTSLPDSAFHRDIDKLVLGASSNTVKTAIVCPPTIYGPGRGSDNIRSRQVYNLVSLTLKDGQTPQLGRGLTEWDNIHVHDLSDLFVLLVEAAVEHKPELDDRLWGKEGYFLAENGHHVWGEVSKEVGKVCHEKGFIKSAEVRAMDIETAKEAAGFEVLSWGLNSKGFAKRARKYLSWKPRGKTLMELIPEIVDSEARLLGMTVGHAEKVAGIK